MISKLFLAGKMEQQRKERIGLQCKF